MKDLLGQFVIWAQYTDDRQRHTGWGFIARGSGCVTHWLHDAQLFDSEADAWAHLIATGEIEYINDPETGEELYRIEPVPYWVEPPLRIFDSFSGECILCGKYAYLAYPGNKWVHDADHKPEF